MELKIKVGNETYIKNVADIKELKTAISDITFDLKIKNYNVKLNGERVSPREIAERFDTIQELVIENRDQPRN